MKGIIHKIIILLILISATSLAAEGNYTDSSDAAALQKMMSDSFSFNQKYDNKFFITTDSGEDWKSITFGYTTYVYGVSHYGSDLYAKSSLEGRRGASGFSGKGKEGAENNQSAPVTTVSWLLKITKYVNLNIREINGKRTVKISKGKLTQGVYSIRLEGSEFKKSLYYYKLESPLGVTTRQVFF